MRRSKPFQPLLLCLALALAASTSAESEKLEITYLGNAGFMLSDGEHTVLIDAIYGDGLPGYPVVDAERRRRLETALPPYDKVDIVLATHYHRDHFDPKAVARHLRANPRAVFVSTPQAVRQLQREAPNFAPLAERAHGILPEEGVAHKVRLLGLDIRLLHLHHGRSRRPPVENLGFLFELGGRKLLHVGDTEATADDLAAYELPAEEIDIALLPSWMLAYDSWAEAVSEGIAAAELVAMHLPVPDAPANYFAPFADLDGLVEEIRHRHPEARVFYSGSIDALDVEGTGETSQ